MLLIRFLPFENISWISFYKQFFPSSEYHPNVFPLYLLFFIPFFRFFLPSFIVNESKRGLWDIIQERGKKKKSKSEKENRFRKRESLKEPMEIFDSWIEMKRKKKKRENKGVLFEEILSISSLLHHVPCIFILYLKTIFNRR